MAVADGLDGELLHVRAQHVELALRSLERRIERGLIAFVERAEVDGLHRGIELLLALGLAVGIGGDEQLGGHDFLAEDCGVGTRLRRREQQSCPVKFDLVGPPQQPTSPEGRMRTAIRSFCPGCRFGQRDRDLRILVVARDHVAVHEDRNQDAGVAADVQVQ